MSDIHIAYASDHAYAPQMEKSIISVLEHVDLKKVYIDILDNGLTETDKSCLISTIDGYGGNYKVHDVTNVVDKMGFIPPRFQESLGLYCRIFLPELLKDLKRVIYLDCDTIVDDVGLEKLWNVDIENYWAGGVKDTISEVYKRSIGLGKEDYYINSGVLLINLSEWRRNSVTEQLIKYIRQHRDEMSLPDQDAINVVCSGKIKILDVKYNAMSPIFLMSYSNLTGYFNIMDYYSEVEIKEARKHPVIIHFTGYPDVRPWEENCHHPLKGRYKQYAEKGRLYLGMSKKKLSWRKKIQLLKMRFLPFKVYEVLLKWKTKG